MEALFGREVEDYFWHTFAHAEAKKLDDEIMQSIAEKQEDRFFCPGCSEDWLFGWKTLSEVKEFLAKKRKIKCVKCGNEFNIAELKPS